MGFYDSMKSGFAKKTDIINESRERSNYKTVMERESEHISELRNCDDSTLLRKFSDSATYSDKKVIASLLQERGYKSELISTFLNEA